MRRLQLPELLSLLVGTSRSGNSPALAPVEKFALSFLAAHAARKQMPVCESSVKLNYSTLNYTASSLKLTPIANRQSHIANRQPHIANRQSHIANRIANRQS